MNDKKETFFTLNSGKIIDLLNPNLEAEDISSLIRGCVQKCRFAGMTSYYYPVSNHLSLSWAIAYAKGLPAEVRKYALVHDLHEALTGDVPTPLKNALGVAWDDIEFKIESKVLELLEFEPSTEVVEMVMSQIDKEAFAYEWEYLELMKGKLPPEFETKLSLLLKTVTDRGLSSHHFLEQHARFYTFNDSFQTLAGLLKNEFKHLKDVLNCRY